MKPSLLFGDLPKTVRISGVEYPVNWGFRAMMLVEIGMYDDRCEDDEKIQYALNIFYGGYVPDNLGEAITKMLWFHRCGEAEMKEGTPRGHTGQHQKRAYDFVADAPYIFAAFLTQYGMRLSTVKNYDLHWWEFRAMFSSLNDDLKMSRIMYYRVADTSGMGKEQKKFVLNMRKQYALKDPEQNLDARTKLAQRNNRMREYVKERFADAAEKA